jgi:hypothetical protein
MNNLKTKAVRLGGALLAALVAALLASSTSFAAEPALKLYVSSPDSVEAGGAVPIVVGMVNVGTAPAVREFTFTDTFGSGLLPPSAEEVEGSVRTSIEVTTPIEGVSVVCSVAANVLTCGIRLYLPVNSQIFFDLPASVAGGASGVLTNAMTLSGPEIATTSAEQQLTVGTAEPFGFNPAGSGADILLANGAADTQAASDPAEATVRLSFNTVVQNLAGVLPLTVSPQPIKDVGVELPPGLIGNPTITPLCTADQLAEKNPISAAHHENIPLCPIDSQIGVAHLVLNGDPQLHVFVPLYNMVTPPGVGAKFGFNYLGVPVAIDGFVRPGDGGITMVSTNASTTLPLMVADVTVWGVPADKSHDTLRGVCASSGFLLGSIGEACPSGAPRQALLRLPTSCSGPLPFHASTDSYVEPGKFSELDFTAPPQTGCDQVPFTPELEGVPTTTAANTPTGFSVRLALPQNSDPDGLAQGDLKKAIVQLPRGVVLNPSAADGLQACTDSELRLGLSGPAQCPDGSKLGTLLLHTPLVTNPVEGVVYLRTQNSSDPASGEMFRVAIEVRDDAHGVYIKVPGAVSADPGTGQLTATFDNNPQLPFSDLTVSFKAGARAPLVTPPACGLQTTNADLYPWARPTTPVHLITSFEVSSGPEGTGCASTAPFAPSFTAGVATPQAGAFTPTVVTFARKDADQSMQRVSVKLPNGLLGSLVGLPLCGEAQANAGTCDKASQIGSVTAGAGAGPTPFYVTGGRAYLTGPYKGAPFGLSVVVPAKAGPFDLGTVVVRARVEIDPRTAQLTETSDPLPQVVGGVPVNLRLVNVTIDRPNFIFNPTDCNPTSVLGTIDGGEGAVAHLENHFQVTNCASLKFAPRFKVSTSSKTSRADGASLNVKLSYLSGSMGTQANIKSVKVELPKALPSQLKTLQKACTASQFETNPAGCPPESVVGHAVVHTQLLPVPLVGPAYFVSHGNEAFPNLIVVLQGYGVTVQLVGDTNIKHGITSTTFASTPDVPFENFELTLPQGKYSALAANGNLCRQKLTMPTTFTAQNGLVIHRNTPIVATGCAKHKATHKRKAAHKHGKHKRKLRYAAR